MGKSIVFIFIILLYCPYMGIGHALAEEELIVSAAASLTNAMEASKSMFLSSNPSVQITFNFASSGALYQQIRHGAPVDIYVSANQNFMDRAENDGLIIKSTRTNFTSNQLVLIVPSFSTYSVTRLNELNVSDFQHIAVGRPETTPVGRYTKAALVKADLWDILKAKLIFANTVRQVLAYTMREEVDAGFVYSSDIRASNGKVKVLMAIEETGPIIYPAAVTTSSVHKDTAVQFIRFMEGKTGQRILEQHGFKPLKKEDL